MKKLFTLAMLALLGISSANAQGLRKTWDFREGFSQKTINALAADQEEFGDSKYWRNYESDATKADNAHYWNASGDFKNSDGYASTHAGGTERIIDELEGLKLGATAAKKFVITYNGDQKANEFESEGGPAIGEMIPHGKSYIWLNGKNETISFSAEVGQTIRIAVESHAVSNTKLGEARGITLTANNGSLTPKFEGDSKPTYYTEYEWDLTGDPGAIADLTIKSTNGCHIYYIIVGEGDDPNANKTKVAYITMGTAASEPAYQALMANDQLVVTDFVPGIIASGVSLLDVMTAPEKLRPVFEQYDVFVISPQLTTTLPQVVSLAQGFLNYYPVLNFNADLVKAWGYGEIGTGEPFAVIKNLKNDLFAGFQVEEDYIETDGLNGMVFEAEHLTGIKPGPFFEEDDVLATNADGDVAYIMAHNLYHNAYIYLPQEAVGNAKLLANALDALKSSKSAIEKVSAPKITLDYKHLNTNISLAMASSNMPKPHIYYTLDGTDPTENSTEYTGVINVTSACTVKAVAIAEGYLLSDVASADVNIFSQPAAPTISQNYESGKTTVTLASATEGVSLWYNYSESRDTTQSMKYTGPVTLTAPATMTVFAVAGGQVFSELTTSRVVVKDAVVRRDVIGHFDANTDEWGVNASGTTGSTVYHFSWGKSGSSIYDTTGEPVSVTTDPETGDEIKVYPEKDYEYWVPSEESAWELKSKGQVLIYQTMTVGMDAGNEAGYNPDSAGDIIDYAPITKQDVQFGGKVSGEPYTGAIQSRVKFQAPFNLVTYVGTAAGGDNVGKMMLQVSADSLNWTNVGDTLKTSTVKRLWKGYERSYEGTDQVYVRIVQVGGGSSVQIYDIYVLNAGEQSAALKQQFDEEYAATGIQEVSAKGAQVMQGIYSINGVRQSGLRRGLNIVVMGDGSVRKVVMK